MKCTSCGSPETHVLDTRTTRYGVRRRRECERYGERWTTYDSLSGLRVLRQHRGTIDPPLPQSIVTPEGEQPPRVRYRGGWVSPGNASSSEEQELQQAQQAEREAARARRNPAVR